MTRPDAIPLAKERLARFLADGAHGDMTWMEGERRGDPRALWPDVRSVIMLGLNYGTAAIRWRSCGGASAARSRSTPRATTITRSSSRGSRRSPAGWSSAGGGDVKVFVDTAALMEKPLAAAAGVGWQGKHTNLVSREYGSWLFLGAILTTLELPPDAPESRSLRQLPRLPRRLPDRGIPEPYRLDARRCISYLTIEHKGPIPRELRPLMGNRIYGCDDCLAVCPWNKFAQAGREAKLAARAAAAGAAARRSRPARRRGVPQAVREIAGQAHRARSLRAQRADRDRQFGRRIAGDRSRAAAWPTRSALVRGAAVWALGRLDPQRLAARAPTHRPHETDPVVDEEWAAGITLAGITLGVISAEQLGASPRGARAGTQ